ncbi:histidine kinase [Streptomyces sp. NPDC127079]|uniref:histidine kinase n=1 Tax=Streptomyces sp. NPDC127079 TaxID=3347132 RepID=UPI003664DCB4
MTWSPTTSPWSTPRVGVAHHLMRANPEQAYAALAHIKNNSRAALEELRATVGPLRRPDDAPGSRTSIPRLTDLDTLVAGSQASGMPVSVARTGNPSVPAPATELTAYRIIQEAHTNTLNAERDLHRSRSGHRPCRRHRRQPPDRNLARLTRMRRWEGWYDTHTSPPLPRSVPVRRALRSHVRSACGGRDDRRSSHRHDLGRRAVVLHQGDRRSIQRVARLVRPRSAPPADRAASSAESLSDAASCAVREAEQHVHHGWQQLQPRTDPSE